METSYDGSSDLYHRCGAGPVNVCYRAGESVLADVTVLRLRCELLFQNSEIGPLVSSVVSAPRVSSLVSAACVVSSLAACVSSLFSAGRVSSVV